MGTRVDRCLPTLLARCGTAAVSAGRRVAAWRASNAMGTGGRRRWRRSRRRVGERRWILRRPGAHPGGLEDAGMRLRRHRHLPRPSADRASAACQSGPRTTPRHTRPRCHGGPRGILDLDTARAVEARRAADTWTAYHSFADHHPPALPSTTSPSGSGPWSPNTPGRRPWPPSVNSR